MDATKDKRVKREIANSNERRRMQSINAGFQKLKRLLPVNDGEKISKANILQHAADFIQSIERDRLALYEQNTLIKEILMDLKNGKPANVNTVLERIDLTVSPTIPINTAAAAAASASAAASAAIRSSTTTTFSDTSDYNSASNNGSGGNHTKTHSRVNNNSSSNDNVTSNDDSIQKTIKSRGAVGRPPKSRQKYNTHQNRITTTANKNGNKQASRSTGNSNNNNSTTVNDNNMIINGCTNHGTGGDGGTLASIKNFEKHNIYHDLTSQQMGNVAEIISEQVASPKNGLAGPGVAKAAIALPLEVPYTTEIVVRHNHDSHPDAAARKLLKTDPNLTTAMDSQDQAPKGQNLDTICKAIMEIEGDRVFKNEAT